MTNFLLRLCGVQVDSASRLAGTEFALRHGGMLGWIITLGLALAVLSWWSYRKLELTAVQRRILIALRCTLFALLLLLILRPVLVFKIESSIRRTLLTLIDTSGSMRIADPRFDEADLKRAAIAHGDLPARKGLQQNLDPAKAAALKFLARADVLKAMFANPDAGLLPRLGESFDLANFSFGQVLGDLPADWLSTYDPKASATALGEATRELLTRQRGQALAGVFLVTDGASNTGSPALEAARMARADGVPLYIYGVGITSPRDLIVGQLFAPDVGFQKDELPVTVRVRGQGLRGEHARVVLTLGSEKVAEKELTFEDDEEQVVALPFSPPQVGEFELRAAIAPREDEAVKDNNAVAQRLKVIDAKVKVLFVESAPRWEFRYLQSTLLRDRQLDLKCVLLEGDPGIAEGAAAPYLAKIPETREELFKYDLIILGDIGAKDFNPTQLEALGDFVSKFGGSLLFLAGPRANPASFKDSPLEKLLPVELPDTARLATGTEHATTLELTAAGRTSTLLRLAPSDVENSAIWSRLGKLYWTAQVGRAKAGAEVLLADSDPARAVRGARMPVFARQQYGLGEVLFVGTDNTWRWRRGTSEKYYPQLWGQIAQKLGLRHVLGGSRRTQLTSDKGSYTVGERVTVYARLYATDYTPIKTPSAEASVTVQGQARDVTLRSVPEQPGMYRGDFVALAPGMHRLVVKSDSATGLEFNVTEPRYELGETALNEPLLKQMADLSGGRYFREEDLWQLPDAIAAAHERIASEVDAELWSSPLFFLMILLVSSAEWILRKRWELK